MPTPSSVFLASLLIAVPAVSVGVHYLSPSSTSGQEQVNEDQAVKPSSPEESSVQSNPQPTVSKDPKTEIAQPPQKPWLDEAKNKLTELSATFPYSKVLEDYTGRPNSFQNFVSETDNVRTGLTNTISELLKQQENKDKLWKDIFEKDLGFTLTQESENDTWEKLATMRKEEAEAQVDSGESLSRVQHSATGQVTSADISKFCQAPTVENSHLGMYAEKRKEQEEKDEYRFFTYYSYCTKESFYLSSKLVFEK